jgi:signal transduction histidine kinase
MRQPPTLSYFLQLILLFLIYSLTGKVGLSLDAISGFATLFWFPTGISLAALLIGGYRYWPAIFMGAFFVNFTNGAPIHSSMGIAIGNTLEAIIATFILQYIIHFRISLDRTRDLFGLTLIAGPIGALVSATVGVSSLLLGETGISEGVLPTWLAWMVGNILSTMLITPFLLIWSRNLSFTNPRPQRLIEGIVVIAILMLACLTIFANLGGLQSILSPINYLIFPPLIWIALRFGRRSAITAVVVVSAFAVISTISGNGPFVRQELSESLILLQIFMGTIALPTLILSVVVNQYKELDKRKDEFISIASHEMKTPITSVTLLTQLLRRRAKRRKDNISLELLEKITKQVKKMAKQIDDLLDLSKIQIGQLELKKEKFAIFDLIQDVVDNVQRIASKHTIVITGQTKKRVYADKERIGQVLTNLLNNAIKYSPKANQIIVSVITSSHDVMISVQDFGLGIAKKDQEKIFEQFYRVKTSDETAHHSFGIGLYVAQEIIKKHHGVLSVSSTKGKGSTFSFSLPLKNKIR